MRKLKKKVYSSPDVSEWSSHEEDEMSGTCRPAHNGEVNYNSLAENME